MVLTTSFKASWQLITPDRRALNETRFSCASLRAHTFQVLMPNLACFNWDEHAQLQETFEKSLQSSERVNKCWGGS